MAEPPFVPISYRAAAEYFQRDMPYDMRLHPPSGISVNLINVEMLGLEWVRNHTWLRGRLDRVAPVSMFPNSYKLLFRRRMADYGVSDLWITQIEVTPDADVIDLGDHVRPHILIGELVMWRDVPGIWRVIGGSAREGALYCEPYENTEGYIPEISVSSGGFLMNLSSLIRFPQNRPPTA
jgi:hypothetical protein